jgi:NADH-quinone oxidoreductase subunit H
MISYELAMFLSVVTVVLLAGSMNLTEIFLAQTPNATLGQETSGLWNVFRFPVGTIAFVVFLIAAFAETNRHPFDMVERETEPVGGFHTEHSSMKFALFFIGEYAAMLTMSALITTLFFGGPSLFGLVASMESPWLRAGVGFAVFITKLAVFQFLFIWVRWTLPRFRWDQVLHLGWKVLLPVSIVNLLLAGALVVWGVY